MKSIFILCLLIPFSVSAQLWVKSNGPYGGSIEGFAAKSTGELYAVNTTGLYKSTDKGENWFLLTNEVLNINTVEIALTGRIYLGTDYRGVWWSDNEGISWSNNQITINTHTGLGASISDISLNSAGHIFVNRWRSINGGVSWSELSIYAQDYLFLSGNEILAATNSGVQKSTNNGSSWFPLNNGMENIRVNCLRRTTAGILIAGTADGGIYISNNNGMSWSQSNSGLSDFYILELGVDENNRIYALTQSGIYFSDNSALSWQQINISLNHGWFYDFDIINGNELFASSQRAGILYSTDNGNNWSTAHQGINVLNNRCMVSNNESGIFLNANGTVYYSSDIGSNWELRNNGLSGTGIITLEIDSDGNLYAGSFTSGLFKSSDNGNNWTNIIIPDITKVDQIVSDSLNRITIDSEGKLYHSPDSGISWNQIFDSDTVLFAPEFLQVMSNGSLFFGGFTFFLDEVVFYSTNYGISWDSVNFGSFNNITSLYSDGNVIYVSFDDGSIKYSADDGKTWQNYPTISFGSDISDMYKLNNGVFLVATNANGVFYTSDNGLTWLTLSSGLPSGLFNFIRADRNNMLYTGYYSEGIYRNDKWHVIVPVELVTFNATVNDNDVLLRWRTSSEINNFGFEIERARQLGDWEIIGFVKGNGTTTYQSDYVFRDSNIEPGKYLYRLKQKDFDGSFSYSNIIEAEVLIPADFVLYQNYPNPFNPSTKIRYSVGEQSLVRIKIFDILGNEVAVLVNELKEPGTYELEFSISDPIQGVVPLSSGTYFYKLEAGNYSETKKFTLMK